MRGQKSKVDMYTVSHATNMSAGRVKGTIARAKTYETDPKKKQRITQNLCVPCFYTSVLAGQAFCSRECGGCETVITSSNTNIDVLCTPCAAHAELCKHCGADLYLRERRRKPVVFPAKLPNGGA